MQLINLPRLKLNELQTVAEKSINLCANIAEVKPAVEKASNTLDTFKEGMQKDKSNGVDKKTQDRFRDIMLSCLFSQVEIEREFPDNTPECQNELLQLNAILKKYSKNIIRLPYGQESAAINNLLGEIKSKINIKVVNSPVSRWIPLIEKENEKFKELDKDFDEKQSVLKTQSSASNIAPYLINALEGLYTLLFAYTQISDNKLIEETYIQLIDIVEAYR